MATKFWISSANTSFTATANWSDGVAPANGDVLVFNHLGTASVTTNTNTTLTGLTIYKEKSYTGQIGSVSGSTVTPLTIDGGTVYYEQKSGQGSPTGSTLCVLDFLNTAATVYQYDSASTSASTYYPPLIVKGGSVTMHVSGGSSAFCPVPGQTGTLTAANVVVGTGDVRPSLYIGQGATVTALTAKGGTVLSRSLNTTATTTINGDAIYTVEGSSAHTTINCDGNGKVRYGSSGTITTLNLSGEFTNEQYSQSFTVTDRNFYPGARYYIDNGRAASVTHTNAYVLKNCGLQAISVRTPPGKNL